MQDSHPARKKSCRRRGGKIRLDQKIVILSISKYRVQTGIFLEGHSIKHLFSRQQFIQAYTISKEVELLCLKPFIFFVSPNWSSAEFVIPRQTTFGTFDQISRSSGTPMSLLEMKLMARYRRHKSNLRFYRLQQPPTHKCLQYSKAF